MSNGQAGLESYAKPADGYPSSHTSKLLHKIRGIVFDFDGTLFDNAMLPFYLIAAFPPDWFSLWRERFIRKRFTGCEYPSPEEYYKAFFAAFGKACYRSPDKMRNWYFNRFMPRMVRVLKRHYKPRPGVIEMFGNFNAQTSRVAVYSDYPLVKERMEALGIFCGPNIRLYGPDSFGAQKPAAGPFRQIAKDMGLAPEEVIVIGDREETDGAGAHRAGMRFFCLETGRRRYFLLDPYRSPIKEKPNGPSLMMYAGAWEDLNKLIMEKYNLFFEEK